MSPLRQKHVSVRHAASPQTPQALPGELPVVQLSASSPRCRASMTRSRRRASPTYPPRPTPARPLRSRASVLTVRARSALLSVRGEDLSTSDRGVLLEVMKDALLAGRAEILRGEPRGVRRLDEHRHDVSTDHAALDLNLFLCSKDDSHDDHPRSTRRTRRRRSLAGAPTSSTSSASPAAATSPTASGWPTSSRRRAALRPRWASTTTSLLW